MKKYNNILAVTLLTALLITGCSGAEAEEPRPAEETQVEKQSETPSVDEKSTNETNTETKEENPTEIVSETPKEEFVRAVDVDQEILDLGDLSYLTLYTGASIEDAVHDFGNPTGSDAVPPVLIYEDFNLLVDFDTELITGFTTYTGEFLDLYIGMSEEKVIEVMGEPHDITGDLELPVYWYYDGDRHIFVGFENDKAISIGYSIYSGREEQSTETQQDYVLRTEEGLILRSMGVEQQDTMLYITGIIENDSGKTLKMIDLQFGIYDANNNIITTTSDYLSIIESGGTWKYKCHISTDEGSSFKVLHLKAIF